jgi:hypothetical protein
LIIYLIRYELGIPQPTDDTDVAHDVVRGVRMTWYPYDVVRSARTTSYIDVVRQARTTTYDVVRAYDIVGLTYDIVCISSYTTSYVLTCISYVLAYNIAYDIVYDIVCDVHSIGFGAEFRGFKLHAR